MFEFEQQLVAPYYQTGAEAARDGLPRSSCPVLADDLRIAWLLGWNCEHGVLRQFAGFKNIEISGRTDMLID
jgi:ribosome modulation factor